MTIMISSPLRGWSTPLEGVPDAVFADGMMGDGVAIHPLDDVICAPFDGEVVTLHASAHAVHVRSLEGAEVLIHVGLDTVALKGRGFTPLVTAGETVKRGDPLIRFDLDAVALSATSLVTPVIVTNSDFFRITRRSLGASVDVSDELMVLERVTSAPSGAQEEGPVCSGTARLALPHGIHARPAARIAGLAKVFEAEIRVVHKERSADARSAVSLLALGTRLQDRVTVEARGADAEAALAAILALLATDMGEGGAAVAPPAPVAAPALRGFETGWSGGIVASPGLAMGPAARLHRKDVAIIPQADDPVRERAALHAARATVRERLEARSTAAGGAVVSIIGAHLALLGDAELTRRAEATIAGGASAGFAWKTAIREQVDALLASGNAHLAERSADLLDIEGQVLSVLTGASSDDGSIPPGALLVADDLLPSQLLTVAEYKPAGICLARGGPTSHVAILCAGMGLPALVAMGDALADVDDGTTILLDADTGQAAIAPSPAAEKAFMARIVAQQARRDTARAASGDSAHTLDGARIEVFANVGSVDDAHAAAEQGAEGCGLVRTEFLFLGRSAPPSEDEQHAAYQRIANALGGRPVIVRLLDVGGDKPAAYIPIATEENPALGVRGIRVGLTHRDLLETQVRAILRMRPAGQCRIMIPMVTSVAEVRMVRDVVERLRGDLGIEEPVQVGVMVETPAAAATADLLAAEADFLSIGSNDLTQYVLAMDRGNSAVAAGVDAMHPAVLRMIAETCRLATRKGRWVGLCGGLASDPAALPILVGVGVTELSAVPGFVPEAKAIVRGLTLPAARAHAARALQCTSPEEVRALARGFQETMS